MRRCPFARTVIACTDALPSDRVRTVRLPVVTVHPQYVIPGRSTTGTRFEIRKLQRHWRLDRRESGAGSAAHDAKSVDAGRATNQAFSPYAEEECE